MIADIQTHRQTRSSQYSALPIGGGVVTYAYARMHFSHQTVCIVARLRSSLETVDTSVD